MGRIDIQGLLAIMDCARFPDHSMACALYLIDGLCQCKKCKKIADTLAVASNDLDLIILFQLLFECARSRNSRKSPIRLEIISPIYTNYRDKTISPIPAAIYRILPKLKDSVDKMYDSDQPSTVNPGEIVYHKGTPSVTGLEYGRSSDDAGKITVIDPRTETVTVRTGIRIHPEGISYGCITLGGKCRTSSGAWDFTANKAGKGYIEKVMNSHASCGGMYLEITDYIDEYKPEGLKRIQGNPAIQQKVRSLVIKDIR